MHLSVTKVTATENYRLLCSLGVEFDNNESGILDMAPYLGFGVFRRLKDPAVFNAARVAFDTVEWPDGIDLDPEFIYEKCVGKCSARG
uniref:DUF2442 domain-containing protein n=1 Tax=Candidatus Kentrum sp. UNK TaxID=2126344 RepID=A0A451ATN6_9GAMM|nr:MAG: Protein of unknown function (DUF2442) [Candidatus Kentron sp. UNK]VFK69393.1 MAG: Protein of unknown function (DUF2442) [Candidatus Kentron sp. UNK]